MAGNTEQRAVAGSTESRGVAGDTEKRGVAGDTEQRRVAGDTEGIRCVITPSCSGFLVKGVPALSYFDGQALKDARDFCVP